MKRILAMVLLLVVATTAGFGERLTGRDWVKMARRKKEAYLLGYIDGRVSEVANVVVLSMKLTAGGKMLYEDGLTGQFVRYIDEKGKVWKTLDITDFVGAVDQAVSENPSILDAGLILFVQDALMIHLRIP